MLGRWLTGLINSSIEMRPTTHVSFSTLDSSRFPNTPAACPAMLSDRRLGAPLRGVLHLSYWPSHNVAAARLMGMSWGWYSHSWTDLVIIFHPLAEPLSDSAPVANHHGTNPLGILNDIVGMTARFQDATLTLVGTDRLPSHAIPSIASFKGEDDELAEKLVGLVEAAIANDPKRPPNAKPLTVDCLTHAQYPKRVGEREYLLETVPPPIQ